MSFFMTQRQVRDQSKTVTRRVGSKTIKAGDLRQPIVKGQGLKKGEKVETIGPPIRVIDARPEPLAAMLVEPYGSQEAAKEGYPGWTGLQFVAMFLSKNPTLTHNDPITRIEFEYTERM